MEIFQTFAEISVGILGFTAIVIMFKTEHTKWNESLFQGMISHCIQALVYSILPFILISFELNDKSVWMICSIVLGLITLSQGVMVQFFDRESKITTKRIMLAVTIILALLMTINAAEIGLKLGKGPYLIGITWHIIQSLVIFTMIVTKGSRRSQ